MVVRTAGAMVTLLIGLAGPGDQVLAQYQQTYPQAYPPVQPYPAPQGYPPYHPLPPLDIEDDDEPSYDAPSVRSEPLPPPVAVAPQPHEPPPAGHQLGRTGPAYPDQAELPPPAGHRNGYRDAPVPVYREMPPPVYRDQLAPVYRDPPPPVYRERPPQPVYRDQPPPVYRDPPSAMYGDPPPPAARDLPQVYEPAAAGTRPYYPPGGPNAPAPFSPPAEIEAVRPPMPISPGQAAPGQIGNAPATGTVRGGDPRMAALPPEVRPETGPRKDLPPQFRRMLVDYRTKEPVGTIIIDTANTYLYLVLGNGKAMRYGIGVGREGFTWAGAEKVSKMAEWPDWNPPSEMIERQPYLPRFMAGGEGNPLGARALYLGKTLYRIHGTNQPSTIGTFVSSGCIRLTNEDVVDLYTRVKVGTRVVVLPGKPPPAAAPPSVVGQPGTAPPVPIGASPIAAAPPGRPPAAIAR